MVVDVYFFAGAFAGSAAFAGAAGAGAASGAFISSDAQKLRSIAKLIIANTLVIFFIDSPIYMSFFRSFMDMKKYPFLLSNKKSLTYSIEPVVFFKITFSGKLN